MKVCPHCGAPVRDNQKICDSCGELTGGGNPGRKNIVMSLLAVLSFAVGLCGIGAYTVHHKRMVLAEQEEEKKKQQAKEKRAEELAAEMLAEQERREKASSSSAVAEPSGQESDSQVQEEEETTYTDLSKLAQQDLQPLVEETGAVQVENGGEYEEYHTENDAVILAYTETGYSVTLDSECIYSLYGVYVGMDLDEAFAHLESRGFRRTEDEEEICYKIDDVDLLYIQEDGDKVGSLRLDVLVGDMQEDTEEQE